MLLARTEPEAPKHAGITWFAIDLHQPGVEVRPLKVMDGTAPFCEIFLTEARVSDSRRIGERGAGWSVARTTLASERAMVAGGTLARPHSAMAGPSGALELTCGEVRPGARRCGNESGRYGRYRGLPEYGKKK